MVQLHVSEETIRTLLKYARTDLGEYSNIIEALYYDLVSDPSVTSLSTIKTHLDKARLFLRWLTLNNVKLSQLSMDHLRRYIIYLRLEKKLSSSTLKTHIRVLRRLLRIMGYSDLAEKLKYPSEKTKPPQLPSPQLIEKIISETKDLRYKTILAIIYETGARISEVLSLRLKHVIETPQGYYRIMIEDAKNGDFRYVYVIKYANLLRHYIETHNIKDPEQLLFPPPQRPGQPLHPRNIEKYLERLSKKYGIRIYPHLLRHLRGTLWIKERIPERVVMKLMGHRSEKMMRVYINLVHQDVEETILQHYGIKSEPLSSTRTRKCPRCGAENREDANYCWRCAYPLHQQAALELELREKEIEEKLRKLIEILKNHPEILKEL